MRATGGSTPPTIRSYAASTSRTTRGPLRRGPVIPRHGTNHVELTEPYNRYIVAYLPRGKWFAKETYGLQSVYKAIFYQ